MQEFELPYVDNSSRFLGLNRLSYHLSYSVPVASGGSSLVQKTLQFERLFKPVVLILFFFEIVYHRCQAWSVQVIY